MTPLPLAGKHFTYIGVVSKNLLCPLWHTIERTPLSSDQIHNSCSKQLFSTLGVQLSHKQPASSPYQHILRECTNVHIAAATSYYLSNPQVDLSNLCKVIRYFFNSSVNDILIYSFVAPSLRAGNRLSLDGGFKWSINNGKLTNKPLQEEVWGVGMKDSTVAVAIVSKGCFSHSHDWKGNNKRTDIFMELVYGFEVLPAKPPTSEPIRSRFSSYTQTKKKMS